MKKSEGERLVTDLFAAMKEQNWDKLENMIHPAFQSVHFDGTRNQSQEMQLLKGSHLGDYSLSKFQITMSEAILVVSYVVSAEELIDGKPTLPKSSCRLSVFHKTDEGWKWVAHASFVKILS
jgi:hypothetical protein